MDCNKVKNLLPEGIWKDLPENVRAVYGKASLDEQNPKYHKTRETLWEVGGTTPQG